jgi:putative FmdB family regulatory protein
MPIYEFCCRACQHRFETLVRAGGGPPQCPSCNSQDLERIISLFAVNSEGTRSVALAAGRRKASKTADEKAAAQREYESKHQH